MALGGLGNKGTGDVIERLDRVASLEPDALLYRFLDAHGQTRADMTRRDLHRRSWAIATHLRLERRLQPGARVVLAYPPGLEMIAALFGAMRAGLIPVPAAAPVSRGVESVTDRLGHIATDAEAAAILTDASTCAVLSAADGLKARGDHSKDWIATDHLEFRESPYARGRSKIAFLQYTSGSTSAPKGVVVTHANLLANCEQVGALSGKIGVTWLPQHHDMGLIGYYINAALIGGELHAFAPSTFIQRPSLWLETISAVKATATSAPNFAYEYCLRPGRLPRARLEGIDLSTLRMFMAAAEPVRPTTFEAFLAAFAPYGLPKESFYVAYGLAENTLAVTSGGRRALSINRTSLAQGEVRATERVSNVSEAIRLMSCGNVLGDTVVRVVNPDSRREVAPARVGEIWVTGASKCAGYWRKQAVTVATFYAHLHDDDRSWLRTGDLGFIDNGELFVCGRLKDLLIVRGHKFFPQDIEFAVERSVRGLRGAIAAFELDGPDGTTEMVAVAEVVGSRAIPDAKAIVAAVKRQVGIELDRILFVPARSIPRTSSGKVMRLAARDAVREGRIAIISEARCPHGRDLTVPARRLFDGILARYRASSSPESSLADLGIDSLELVSLLHEIASVLEARGCRELAGELDLGMLQGLTFAELENLSERLERDPHVGVSQVRRMIKLRGAADRVQVRAQMEIDRRLPFNIRTQKVAPSDGEPKSVLLTGGTGFLGPFLLKSLLEQTDAEVLATVRAPTATAGAARLREGLLGTGAPAGTIAAFDGRVQALPADLEQPGLALSPTDRQAAEAVDAVFHNGAVVNYLFTYGRMRAANVGGTAEAIRIAATGRPKPFNYVSTTFIFGWASKDILSEADNNDRMELLDFGYSQSKWAAEQVVMDARRQGLAVRVFRPALITPALNGRAASFDITLRILAFMVRHCISVGAKNQVSFTPADVIADNIVAICRNPATIGEVYHMTRDDFVSMHDVVREIEQLTGRSFTLFELRSFVPEVVRRCTIDDPLFPLLEFLVGSIDSISSMEFKRYDNSRYRWAREGSPGCRPDPPLRAVVGGILAFMQTNGMAELGLALSLRSSAR